MRQYRRGSWIDTRRELAQLVWAVLLIDAIALGLGALAARPMGAVAYKVGAGLAVFVTVAFTLIIAGNLVVESLANWWITRRGRNASRTGPPDSRR